MKRALSFQPSFRLLVLKEQARPLKLILKSTSPLFVQAKNNDFRSRPEVFVARKSSPAQVLVIQVCA